MKVDGACACGAIKVEAEADPEKTQVCHCTDCQTATGTAFRVSIPVAGATFKIIGKPAIYVKTTAESGRPRVQAFCGTCGSPIYSTTPGEGVQPCGSAFCASATSLRRGASFGGDRHSHGSPTSPASSDTKNKADTGANHDRDRIPLAAEARLA